MNNPLRLVLAAALVLLPATVAANPLENYAPEAVAGAVKLRRSLECTVWAYQYGGKDFEIGLDASGRVQLLEAWKGVRWRVISPREVILDGAGGDHMLLRFGPTLRQFTTRDWDGKPATGRLTAKVLPVVRHSPASPKVDLRPMIARLKMEVRDQGKRGACQVFAFVGVVEYQFARHGKPVDLSEQFLMWAANDANGLSRTEGFNPDFLIAGLKKHGICQEYLMPYVPRNEPIGKPSPEALRDGRTRTACDLVSIKHWSSDIGFQDKEVRAICGHLDKGAPVTATFCWPDGLPMAQMVDAGHFLVDRKIDGKSKDGHGVVLVGYGLDDAVPGGGYFIFRNSWGVAFADRGYARLTFAYARKYGIDAYIVSVR